MKKYIYLLVTIISLITLVSCIDTNSKVFEVRFFYEDTLIITKEVKEGELVTEHIIENVKWYDNDSLFDFNTEITKNYELVGIKDIEVTSEHKVTFIDHGEELAVAYVNDGDIIEEIEANPLKDKLFIGWYLGDVLYNFETFVVKDIVLESKYVNKFHTVTVKDNNQIVDTFKIEHRGTLNLDNRINTDTIFNGWFNGKYLFTNETIVYTDLVLEAKYKEDDYNLDTNTFDIFHLNDTHGAALNMDNELGLAKISNYIKNINDNNSKNIFITSGDMLQGQLVSNQNRGAVMIESFNEMNLDAFVLGNHEFDWGLEQILKYFNPNSGGLNAKFPLLGANVIDKTTGKRPEFMDEYAIIERDGYKVGIIGVIGNGLESSISQLRVENYEFTSSYQAVSNVYNKINDLVDFVVVSSHASDMWFNEQVSDLNKVQAIFNGHAHQNITGGLNEKRIPYMQSSSSGRVVGHMKLTLKLINEELKLIDSNSQNVNYHTLLNSNDELVKAIVDKYYDDVKHLYDDTILTARSYMSQNDLASYISKLMMEVTNSVAGFQNSGGTRSPLQKNQKITAADLFKIFPFDNQIIVSDISGRNLKKLLNDNYFYKTSKINTNTIKDDGIYQIATNDYIYYSNYNNHLFENRKMYNFGDMYETFYQVMLNLKEAGHKEFDTNSPIIY